MAAIAQFAASGASGVQAARSEWRCSSCSSRTLPVAWPSRPWMARAPHSRRSLLLRAEVQEAVPEVAEPAVAAEDPEAEAEAGEEEEEDALADEDSAPESSWAREQLAALEAEAAEEGAAAQYSLNFLYLAKNIAVSVDQVFKAGQRSPLTEYFFWPRRDAWEELKTSLEGKDWISDRDRVLLLNKTTEVINFWQDEESKHTVEEAREKFPDCQFEGA